MPNNPQDISPTGGQPTGAPDFPPASTPLDATPRYTLVVPITSFVLVVPGK